MVFARFDGGWGIRGSAFAASYAVTLAVLVTTVAMTRYQAVAGRRAGTPTVEQAAVIVGGRSRAVTACLAALRCAGAIDVRPGRGLLAIGPAMDRPSRLEVAVYRAAVNGLQIHDLLTDRQVAHALDEVEAEVRGRRWVLTDGERRRVRAGAWLLLALALVGCTRALAVLVLGGGIGPVPALAAAAGLGAAVLGRPPRVSWAGRRTIGNQRKAYGHLAPEQRPSWTTYGLHDVAVAVALYGPAALWSADPAFATAAGLAPASHRRLPSRAGEFAGGGPGGGENSTCGGGGDGCGD
jgi:uncharacterized protein (TIGR04222 family)